MSKSRLFLILAILVGWLSSASAYSKATDSVFKRLHNTIDRRDTYYTMHKWKIDSVKRVLSQTGPEEPTRRAHLLHDIFERYKSFQGDSAIAVAERELTLASLSGDKEAIVKAKGDKLFSLVSKGNFSDAVDIVRNTDMHGVTPETRGAFYQTCIRLYSDMSNYYSGSFANRYTQLYRAYADSVIMVMPKDSYEAQYASIFKSLDDLTEEQKIHVFQNLMESPKVSDADRATLASIIGDIYIRLNDREKAMQYKAESAISDIVNAKRETTSLRTLAEMMFQDDEYEQASRYINVALEDANFFNAPQRKSEIANVLPLIESHRYDKVNSQKQTLLIVLCVCFGLFIVMILAVIFYIRAARKLRVSNQLLTHKTEELDKVNKNLENANHELENANAAAEEANHKLQETIQKMQESVKIKDEYLGYTLYTNSEYIKRIENLHNLIKSKLRTKQYDALAAAINDHDLTAERKQVLKDFDRVFLRIFPHYIEQYEALFDPQVLEDSKSKKDSDRELSAEMRIFAMIRLGVTDISKIALFLDYSVNTVNTYKTRAKNRSKLPNEQFEPAIMKIKSV